MGGDAIEVQPWAADLVADLNQGSAAAKITASRAIVDRLNGPATDPAKQEARDAVRDAGGIPPLIIMVQDGDVESQENALWALMRLVVSNRANKVEVFQRAHELLIDRMKHGSPLQKERAAQTLGNSCSGIDEHKVATWRAGGIEPLVVLAREGTGNQREYAAGSLLNISNIRSSPDASRIKNAIVDAGGREALSAMVTNGPTPNHRRYAEGALRQLPQFTPSQAQAQSPFPQQLNQSAAAVGANKDTPFGAQAAPQASPFGNPVAQPYQVTSERESMPGAWAPGQVQTFNYMSISRMASYCHKSFEELRCDDYERARRGSGGKPPAITGATPSSFAGVDAHAGLRAAPAEIPCGVATIAAAAATPSVPTKAAAAPTPHTAACAVCNVQIEDDPILLSVGMCSPCELSRLRKRAVEKGLLIL
jgi:hypothetical protein